MTGYAHVDKRKIMWAYNDEELGTIFTRYENCLPGDSPNQLVCDEIEEGLDAGNKGMVLITAKEDNKLSIRSHKGYHFYISNAASLFEF